MLTQEEREDLQARLLAMAAQLRGDSEFMANEALRGDSKDESGHLSSVPQHMADRASDYFEQSFTLGRLESANEVQAQIAEALDRLAAGAYGVCEQCDAEIPYRRLKIKPYANLCVQCQEEEEAPA